MTEDNVVRTIYALWWTDAPEAYDYGGTKELINKMEEGGVASRIFPKGYRVVAIPLTDEWQVPRYMSGAYTVLNAGEAANWLHAFEQVDSIPTTEGE